jgi:peptide deformylase
MALRSLRLFPDPLLKEVSAAFSSVGADAVALLDDLADTLDAMPGVGLAAPQIGDSRRAVIVDVTRGARPGKPTPKNHGRLALINPSIVRVEGTQTFREGCLSVPEFLADIVRAAWVRVEAWDRDGRPVVIETDGFEAVALQHEIDHLDGLLFLDRVADIRTGLLRRKPRPVEK